MGKITKYLQKWMELSGREKLMLFKASVSLLLIKAGLSFLPFSHFRKIFHWFSASVSKREISVNRISEVVCAVQIAANVLPFELLCLPRALATKYLLKDAASLTLEIGVEINPGREFEAHAWVERDGEVIIGDWSDSVSYQRLWVWQ